MKNLAQSTTFSNQGLPRTGLNTDPIHQMDLNPSCSSESPWTVRGVALEISVPQMPHEIGMGRGPDMGF